MSAARVLHVNEGADDFGAVTPFGSAIFRTGQTFSFLTKAERDVRHAAFADLLADGRRRGAVASIARAWGVSDTMVRRVRDGLSPLTDERVSALPAGLRAAFEERVAAPIQLRLTGF